MNDSINFVEALIHKSVQNNNEEVKKAGEQLLLLITHKSAVHVFLQIINSSSNDTSLIGSTIYLIKAIKSQWEIFTSQEKIEIQENILNIFPKIQKYPACSKIINKILKFFLKRLDTDGFPSLFPFLLSNQDNQYFSMIIFYSNLIEFLPTEFIVQNVDYIFQISSKVLQENNNYNNVPEKIAAFHICQVLANVSKNTCFVENFLIQMGDLLLTTNFDDTVNPTEILLHFRSLIPLFAGSENIQSYFYQISVTFASNTNLPPFLRNYALFLVKKQIKMGLIANKDIIFSLINLSHQINLIEIIGSLNEGNFCIVIGKNDIIRAALSVIPEDELFQFILSIVHASLQSNEIPRMMNGIVFLGHLMGECESSSLLNENTLFEIIVNLLHSPSIELLCLTCTILCHASREFRLIPLYLPQTVVSLIFNENRSLSDMADNAYSSMSLSKSFDRSGNLDLVWNNLREKCLSTRPDLFLQVLDRIIVGIAELDDTFLTEIICLIQNILGTQNDKEIFRKSLELASTLMQIDERVTAQLFPRIRQFIIFAFTPLDIPNNNTNNNNENVNGVNNVNNNNLNNNSYNEVLISIVFSFITNFILKLKRQSFFYLKDLAKEIITKIYEFNERNTFKAGCLIVKYWNCKQLAPLMIRRSNSYIGSVDSFLIVYLIRYLSPSEAVQIFNIMFCRLQNGDENAEKVTEKLIKYSHEENQTNFVEKIFRFNNKSLYENQIQVFRLSCSLVCSAIQYASSCAMKLLENYLIMINSILKSEKSDFFKSEVIGVLGDAASFGKIEGDLAVLSFINVLQLTNQETYVGMRQNICYFFNKLLILNPEIIQNQRIEMINQLVFTIVFWINEFKQHNVSIGSEEQYVIDNASSLLLEIISLQDINTSNEQILVLALQSFPPQDFTEVKPMAKNIITIYAKFPNMLPMTYTVMAMSIAKLLLSGPKQRHMIKLEQEVVKDLVTIFRGLMGNRDIALAVGNLFAEYPRKMERLNLLLNNK